MIITGTNTDEVIRDTGRRDQLTGGDGADIFYLRHDNKRDTILDFQDGSDKIDLTDFNVTFDEVYIRQIADNAFVFTIRGESNAVYFAPPGPLDPPIIFDADDFIFNPGAAAPTRNLVTETDGADRLWGTSRPDTFVMNPDGMRDAIRRFELGKDIIDLQTFDTSFENLVFTDVKDGRVRIDFGSESLVITDGSRSFTAADFAADDFIF